MSYLELKNYVTGLRLYKRLLILHIEDVEKEVARKEPLKKKVPTTVEKFK